MKMNPRLVPALALFFITLFAACKKEQTPEKEEDPKAEIQAHSEDQNSVSGNLEDVSNDVNVALESSTFFSARVQNINNVCGATAFADTQSNPRTITITYNGPNCTATHLRTGTVVVSIPANVKWKDAGAAITVSIQNLKVKRILDNKSVTINGSQTLTNVSGGLLKNLASLQTIMHTTTSNSMSITFDDGTQRNWQVARKRTFTYQNGIVMTVNGIGTNGTITNASEWGTNRFGHVFVTSITQPLVVRQDCNLRLTSGEVKHQGFATSTATFGLNANGVPTGCPGAAAYYCKLVWTGPGGNTHSVILPY